MEREFTNEELIAAVLQIKGRLPDLFAPEPHGFSYKARTWVDHLEKNLDFIIDELPNLPTPKRVERTVTTFKFYEDEVFTQNWDWNTEDDFTTHRMPVEMFKLNGHVAFYVMNGVLVDTNVEFTNLSGERARGRMSNNTLTPLLEAALKFANPDPAFNGAHMYVGLAELRTLGEKFAKGTNDH